MASIVLKRPRKAQLLLIGAAFLPTQILPVTPAGAQSTAAMIVDGGFETQAGSVADYCYFWTPCPTGAWSGNGGFARQGAYTWGVPIGASNPMSALVQGTTLIEQTITATKSGSFRVVFMMAGRPSGSTWGGNQTVNVTINGTSIGSFSTTSGAPFVSRITGAFSMTNGSTYALRFTGAAVTDQTAFIDLVRLVDDQYQNTYLYDARGRLIEAAQIDGSSNTAITTYGLDKADNRSNVTTMKP